MIEWNETRAILQRAGELAADGATSAVATVVGIRGSAYRRPGARFLVEPSGATLGGVSGGCLETDVREVAAAVIAGEPARLLHYDTGAGDEAPWGLGLGCEGAVDVLVSALGPAEAGSTGRRVLGLLAGEEPFVLAVVVSSPRGAGAAGVWDRSELDPHAEGSGRSAAPDLPAGARALAGARLRDGRTGLEPLDDALVFFQVFTPPPELLVCGAGDDAMPLARYAAEAGLRLTVVDHRPGFLEPSRFPDARRLVHRRPQEGLGGLALDDRTFAVVMSHSLETDRGWLDALLPTRVPYIGLLGPRDRARELLAGASGEDGSRLYAPVGLDVGAEGPSQVAMSILSEVLAVRAGRAPRSLRERGESIHAT